MHNANFLAFIFSPQCKRALQTCDIKAARKLLFPRFESITAKCVEKLHLQLLNLGVV